MIGKNVNSVKCDIGSYYILQGNEIIEENMGGTCSRHGREITFWPGKVKRRDHMSVLCIDWRVHWNGLNWLGVEFSSRLL
jgi:hypothetical protein